MTRDILGRTALRGRCVLNAPATFLGLCLKTQGLYLEPLENNRELQWPRPSTPWKTSGQVFQGGGEEENSEDGYDNPVAIIDESSSPGRENVIDIGAGSFRFELPSFERGIGSPPPIPFRFLLDNLHTCEEIVPFEEGELSLS